MLRRKLLIRIGVLVLGFVAGAVVAIVLLQNVLRDLDAMAGDAALLMDGIVDLSDSIAHLELRAGEVGSGRALDATAAGAEAARLAATTLRLGEHPLMQGSGPGGESFARLEALVRPYLLHADALIRGEKPSDAARAVQEAAPNLRHEAALLARISRAHVAGEQHAVSSNLRLLVIGLTAAALVMVNVAVFALLRTGQMILRPVEALVRGSRELARERFDHRVRLAQTDEFGELAHAYNSLAEQLQANEARKVEVLQQVAVTLNHELNNVISVIELQLGLLDRRAGGDAAQALHLRRIRDNLGRMTQTVASLKDVRRIVLTDYVPGQKMVDLRRSADAPSPGGVAPAVPELRGAPAATGVNP